MNHHQDTKSGSDSRYNEKNKSNSTNVVGIKNPYFRELIPPNVGTGPHRKSVQTTTLVVWSLVAAGAVFIFFQPWYSLDQRIRAAALGLIFPGAGYLASANLLGAVLLALTWLAIPFSLFAWFGAGAIVFPLLVWTFSIAGAYVMTEDTVWEPAGILAPTLLAILFLSANASSASERARAVKRRSERNKYIPRRLAELDKDASNVTTREEDYELDLESLRKVQYLFDHAFQSIDDWSGFVRIDQFQTSAMRYQLYQMMYALALYQCTYVPNAHGYINEAYRRVIDKSLTPDILNFWKWERLAGKFSFDSDPIQNDNIMVSGFLLQGVMLYTANTGDLRYTQPGSLEFCLGKGATYKYSLHDLQATLIRQWSASPYFLIPCEPNWIYVVCNLQGMMGAIAYDRFFGTKSTDILLPIFEESLNTNFSNKDGSILTIRSELTGFTIPGLCAATGDLTAVDLAGASVRHLSRRMWAILREETIKFNEKTGDIAFEGLIGADLIDPGNYKKNSLALLPQTACAAAEHGDEALKKAALDKMEQGWGYVTEPSGAKHLNPSRASTLLNYETLKATLLQPGAYERLVKRGPPEVAMKGPILSEVPYPGVLIAKARSHSSRDLELVLYPSADAGTFKLGVTRLEPAKRYTCQGKTLTADDQGSLSLSVLVDGRTHLHIVPDDSQKA